MSSIRALSGVKHESRNQIRLREHTAVWQLIWCILFTWQACSTTRHDKPSLPGRYQSAPIVKEQLIIDTMPLKSL